MVNRRATRSAGAGAPLRHRRLRRRPRRPRHGDARRSTSTPSRSASTATTSPHRAAVRAVESLRADDPRLRGADLWWTVAALPALHAPGQAARPRRSAQPRASSISSSCSIGVRPPALALENVPEMRGSQAHARLREVLDRNGYAVAERLLCPTELGIPNRRRRFYLVASRDAPDRLGGRGFAVDHRPARCARFAPTAVLLPRRRRRAASCRRPRAARALRARRRPRRRRRPGAVAATFTAAYGRSPVRAGSYLRRNGHVARRFSPAEILRLLGFPASYRLPAGPAARQRLAAPRQQPLGAGGA